MSYKFSDFAQNPLLEPEKVDDVLTLFPVFQESQELAQIMPLVNVNADKLEMDVEKAQLGGMTPAVAMGSESPIHGQHGRGKIEFEFAEFREKVQLVEKDLVNVTKLGTMDELISAREMLQKKYMPIEKRLSRRLEWMRRQMLFDQQVTAPIANGAGTLTVNYVHADYLEPTAGTLWSDLANSEPLSDLQLWAENYMLDTGWNIARIKLPLGCARLLTGNNHFQEIAKSSYSSFNGSNQAVRDIIGDYIGVGTIEESKGRIPFVTELKADASAAQADVVLRDVSELAAGDTVILRKADRTSEKLTVSSISGNTVTMTSNLSNAYVAGEVARYHKMTIPEDQILFIGTPADIDPSAHDSAVNTALLSQFADVASGYSRYVDLEPRPGVFTKLIDNLNGDPPSIEQVIGIRALPRLNYQEGWMTATFK